MNSASSRLKVEKRKAFFREHNAERNKYIDNMFAERKEFTDKQQSKTDQIIMNNFMKFHEKWKQNQFFLII